MDAHPPARDGRDVAADRVQHVLAHTLVEQTVSTLEGTVSTLK